MLLFLACLHYLITDPFAFNKCRSCYKVAQNLPGRSLRWYYLKKSVANKRNEKPVSLSLDDATRILRRVHGREVKHSHVRLSVVVVSELQVRKPVPGRYLGGFASVRQQCGLVHVVFQQQPLRIFIVLCSFTVHKQQFYRDGDGGLL